MTYQNYFFDVTYDNDTYSEIMKKYQYTEDETIEDVIKNIINDRSWIYDRTSININNNVISVGDKIRVEYIPNSQTYINYYENKGFEGTVIFIDPYTHNMFCFIETNEGIIIRTLETEGCHYYGLTKGYDTIITRIKN